MRSLIVTLCLGILLLISGCSGKAPQGEGGIAEHSYNNNYSNNYSNAPDHPVGLESALYFELEMSRRHLDALLADGAKICFPAVVKKAQVRQARVVRELQGGLPGDAANDLIIQRDQLERLERRLNYVQLQESCMPTDHYKGNEPAHLVNTTTDQHLVNDSASQSTDLSDAQQQYLLTILNNNNQFVFNSAELNPRYIGQLSEATQLLREHPQYRLKLTGHSDSKGDATENLRLSLQRASQVERYLLIFGLSPNNIEVAGSGSTEPLFDDDLPQARLVNRRVSIELINSGSVSEAMPQ